MASTLKNNTISIQKLGFDIPGKISLKLEDGRLIIIPLKYFPELQKLPLEKRKKYTIVDDRTVLFSYSDSIYHLEDFIGLENKWKER
jgi:hypothetical protein